LLNSRQRVFCEHFLQTGDADAAAAAAGYRRPGQGEKMLNSAALWIDWSREQYHCRVAGRQEILEFYTALMRGETEGECEAKLSERLKGAEALSRILGLFAESAERPAAVRIIDDCPLPETGGDDDV